MAKLAVIFLIVASAAALADDDAVRTIAVSGFGSVETPPDRATLSLSIVAREPNVSKAQERAAEVAAKVLKLADQMDIPENRVDTMSATVRPEYRWNRDSEVQELIGYIAQRQMRLEIHDLEKVGMAIEQAVEAGVNQVAPPQLSSSKRQDAYRDALARAAEDARKNAEQIAASLGLRLGDAIQVSAGSPPISPRPPMPMARMESMVASDSAPQTYNAGELTVTATISVVFETLP